MTLSRRQILAGAASAAAGAALPAAAIARSVAIGVGIECETWPTVALDGRPLMPVEFSKRVMARALREQGTRFEEITGGLSMDDVEWFQLRGRPPYVAFDPVRHPEGREDPMEYA